MDIHGRAGHSDHLSAQEKGSLDGKRDPELGGKVQSSLSGTWPEASTRW